MRILLDTNILIGREDPRLPPEGLAELLRILNENKVALLVHPASVSELERDPDAARRSSVLAKVASYAKLEQPPLAPSAFTDAIGGVTRANDRTDALILYALQSDAVSFLLTEDRGLLQRASRVGLQDRVLTIRAGLEYFSALFAKALPPSPLVLKQSPLHALNLGDSFFESIKSDYDGFESWYRRCAQEGRECIWLEGENGGNDALLIYKDETEPLIGRPSKRRLKICTMKVAETRSRQRVSELLLSWVLRYADENGFTEAYLTIFPRHELQVAILETFGFSDVGEKGRERVLLKRLVPDGDAQPTTPYDFFRTYFPHFTRGNTVRKFLIPVQPTWHDRLFPEYHSHRAQKTIDDYAVPASGGNAIRKAYLCHSRITKIRPGDIVLFYRSRDVKLVTHLGLVEQAVSCTTLDRVIDVVGNRTVLPFRELESLCEKPTLVILFWSVGEANRKHPKGVGIHGIVSTPQSIVELGEGQFQSLCN